jgi:multiple sugar transport system substrate-binding protein
MAPTIKDIAKLAGVSQGTVSNVLNGKGIVSVEKIRRVEEATQKIGYKINEKARILRKGTTSSIAVVLPNIKYERYVDFFLGLKSHATLQGYSVKLYTTDDFPANEERILDDILSSRVDGIAVASCLQDHDRYLQARKNGVNTIFFERKSKIDITYAGFDYREIGREIALDLGSHNYSDIGIFTGFLDFSFEKDFWDGIVETIEKNSTSRPNIHHIQAEYNRAFNEAFGFFENKQNFDVIISSNIEFTKALISAHELGGVNDLPAIASLAAINHVLEPFTKKYELNYRLLGSMTGEYLISQSGDPDNFDASIIIPAEKTRIECPRIVLKNTTAHLNVLTLESPSTNALKKLSPYFTKSSGIDVRFTVLFFDELFEAISNEKIISQYDVLRIDMAWLPQLAKNRLLPLNGIKTNTGRLFDNFIDGLPHDYFDINGTTYAVPFDPSVQVLYYRKDLFEDAKIRRQFYETYHRDLDIPQNFEDFNRIAAFFTQKNNPDSPVEYGTITALGNLSMVACEYLPRFFSFATGNKNIAVDSPEAIKALESYMETMEYSLSTTTSWWKLNVNEFISGKLAMIIVFSNYASDIIRQHSTVSGNVGSANIPGGNPLLGGGVLCIPKSCQNSEKAFSFIEWACGEAMSNRIALLSGSSPCKSVYENMEILSMYPWLSTVKDSLKIGKRRYSQINPHSVLDERKFEHILGMAIKNALSEIMTPKEALKYAQDILNGYMKVENS